MERGKSGQLRALHLLKYKLLATVGVERREQPPFNDGKGEKVRQELTSSMVTCWLFLLEAASSRIPLTEGCPPKFR